VEALLVAIVGMAVVVIATFVVDVDVFVDADVVVEADVVVDAVAVVVLVVNGGGCGPMIRSSSKSGLVKSLAMFCSNISLGMLSAFLVPDIWYIELRFCLVRANSRSTYKEKHCHSQNINVIRGHSNNT
jgi:hypothetical protein